jgi:predicted AlkP superfamily phosphohydrolase/phosphomutase
MSRRMLVVGLDCLAPALAFDRYLDAMPNLARLLPDAAWGVMRSCDPPITVPAWMVMATSRQPGSLGVYGFRHRRPGSYAEGWTANASTFDRPAVWDHLGETGRRACLVGVPPSHPPRPAPGWRVGCFLTPGVDAPFTHPADLADEVLEVVPDYTFDVRFRTDDRDRVLRELRAMADGHFDLVEHLMTTRPWDLLWLVEIGTDRVHHAFWKFADPGHPGYVPGNPYEHAIRDYYALMDRRLGRLLDLAGADTDVLVVSDHGAMAMRGAFAVNQWLVERGWLALRRPPAPGARLEDCDVDWSRTRAWAWGGYYARVFLNVAGREPEGTVPAAGSEAALDELAAELERVTDDRGRPMANRVLRPGRLYPECRGDVPDLMVYFDDLAWRAAGTLGWGGVHLADNDTGPDDAVHAHDACFVLRGDGIGPGRRDGLTIYDVAPTILERFGEPVPAEMEGVPCR